MRSIGPVPSGLMLGRVARRGAELPVVGLLVLGGCTHELSPMWSVSLPAPARVVHVAAAGDVNGDGYADITAQLAKGRDSVATEEVLYFGGPDGLTAFEMGDSVIDADGLPSAHLGVGVGDVDGDGFDDLAAGNTWRRGAADGPLPYAAFGDTWADEMLSGDLDGDGRSDLVELTWGDWWTSIAVYTGSGGGPVRSTIPEVQSNTVRAFEASVAVADVDGDGFSDLVVVGVPSDSVLGEVYPGSAEGLASVPVELPAGEFDGLPSGLVSVGDVDGDGTDDIALGGTEGVVWLLHGSPDGLVEAPELIGDPEASNDEFAASVAGLELPGRGVVVVATGISTDIALSVYVDAGGGLGDAPSAVFVPEEGSPNREERPWERLVANAGDVDGDGVPDLLVGTPGSSETGCALRVYSGDELY